MAVYKINSTGNPIEAEQPFMDANYPGNYTLLTADSAPTSPTIISNEALMARIQNIAGFNAIQAIFQQAQTNATLEVFVAETEAAVLGVDLLDERVTAGSAELVTLNIVTSAQATTIFSPPVLPSEQPQ